MKRQAELSGMERESVQSLDDACSALLEAKETKAAALAAVKDREDEVQQLLEAHGVDAYWYIDGERRWLFSRERVERTKVVEVVKKKKRGGGDDSDDDGDYVDVEVPRIPRVVKASACDDGEELL